MPTRRLSRAPTTERTFRDTSGCSMQWAWKSRREMNTISVSAMAMAEAGYGPPSKTGSSATDSPSVLTASTCSRPLRDVLKMRILPRAMMCKPLHGSPSEKSSSPALNSLRKERAASCCTSVGERLEKSGVFSRTEARSMRCAVTRAFYQPAGQTNQMPGCDTELACGTRCK